MAGKNTYMFIKKGESYSQNDDGSPHDGSKGSPPNSILEDIKNRFNWDWGKKQDEHNRRNMKRYNPAVLPAIEIDLATLPPTGDDSTPDIVAWIIELFSE